MTEPGLTASFSLVILSRFPRSAFAFSPHPAQRTEFETFSIAFSPRNGENLSFSARATEKNELFECLSARAAEKK